MTATWSTPTTLIAGDNYAPNMNSWVYSKGVYVACATDNSTGKGVLVENINLSNAWAVVLPVASPNTMNVRSVVVAAKFAVGGGQTTDNTVVSTSTNGVNWTPALTAPNSVYVADLYTDGANIAAHVWGGSDYVSFSSDGGGTFSALNQIALNSGDLISNIVVNGTKLIAFVGDGSGLTPFYLMVSNNAGSTWTKVLASAISNAVYNTQLIFLNGVYYALSLSGTTLYTSTSSDGVTWTQKTATATLPTGSGILAAVTYNGSIYLTTTTYSSTTGVTLTVSSTVDGTSWVQTVCPLSYNGSGNITPPITTPAGLTFNIGGQYITLSSSSAPNLFWTGDILCRET